MVHSSKSNENMGETSFCSRNHVSIGTRFYLFPSILFLLLWCALIHSSENNDPVLSWFFWLVILIVFGLAIWEAVDLVRKDGLSSCCSNVRMAVALGLCLLPWAWHLVWYLVAPGFLIPFIHNWIVQIGLGIMMLWQIIGLVFLSRTRSPKKSFLVLMFFIFTANFALAMFPLIGPAMITIANALWSMPK